MFLFSIGNPIHFFLIQSNCGLDKELFSFFLRETELAEVGNPISPPQGDFTLALVAIKAGVLRGT